MEGIELRSYNKSINIYILNGLETENAQYIKNINLPQFLIQ